MSVRRRQHVSASTYVDGNTVRKVQRTVEIRQKEMRERSTGINTPCAATRKRRFT